MDYCILIELSKETIAFSYYTKDCGKFEPYGDELVRPLAIWFNGNNIILGKRAKHEAKRGTQNAFFHLFDEMGKQALFEYSNESHAYNKLILYAIRSGLKEFFMDIMKSYYGTLDENISRLPLLLMLSPDVEKNERLVLVNQLKGNGFGNVTDIDEDEFLREIFVPKETSNKANVVISSNGNDLYGSVYSGNKCVDTYMLKDFGIDPRVDKLVDLLWERSMAETCYLEKADEEAMLKEVATKFIQSGDVSFNDNITFSDGQQLYAYLDRNDLTTYTQHNGGYLAKEILGRLENCGGSKQSYIILKNSAARNRYLFEQLAVEFPHVIVIDKDKKEKLLAAILTYGKSKNFQFVTVITNPIQHPCDADRNTPKEDKKTIDNEQPVATREDKRRARDIEGSIKHGGDRLTAISEARTFLKEMHDRGINEFDDRFAQYIQESQHTLSRHDINDIKRSIRLLRSYIQQGDILEAKKVYEELQVKDLGEFSVELEELSLLISKKKDSKKLEPKRPKPSLNENKSLGAELARKNDFKGARDAFRQEKQEKEASMCADIVKWQNRYLGLYERDAAARKMTSEMAKRCAKETEQYISKYKFLKADTSRLENLLKTLKTI